MSVTLPGLLLIASAVALSALFVVMLRPDSPRPALLSRLRSSSLRPGRGPHGTAGTLVVAAVAFILVAGIGAAASYFGDSREAAGWADAASFSRSHSGLDGETLARLEGYAHTTGAGQPSAMPAGGKLLPDVNTMIERLVARLETTPEDTKGWGMLAWSYFHTGRYEEAATAYAKAVELDPNSADLRRAYEQARAKASGTDAPLQTGAARSAGDNVHVSEGTRPEAPGGQEAAIRAMVDGLAARLESSPRDVEGWTRLMRSRVVLGEREVAATAFRKALEIFKDDEAASGKVKAAAIALGLKAE
jgi:cytochrome c-type biogenesis protein CcmH